MISLSAFALMQLQSLKPKASDFEMDMSMKNNYAKKLESFISELFEASNFKCSDDGICKEVVLEDHLSNTSVKIRIKESVQNDKGKILLQEYSKDTLLSQYEESYSTLKEFKNALDSISSQINNG